MLKKYLFIIILMTGIVAAQDTIPPLVSTNQTLGVDSIIRVYDGDTFYANLFSIPDIFGKNIGIRLYGVDTPELNSKDSCSRVKAKAAKTFLEQKLKSACKVKLTNITRDKYFRIDAIIYADGVNINDLMISSGHAKPYTGEGPKPTYTCTK